MGWMRERSRGEIRGAHRRLDPVVAAFAGETTMRRAAQLVGRRGTGGETSCDSWRQHQGAVAPRHRDDVSGCGEAAWPQTLDVGVKSGVRQARGEEGRRLLQRGVVRLRQPLRCGRWGFHVAEIERAGLLRLGVGDRSGRDDPVEAAVEFCTRGRRRAEERRSRGRRGPRARPEEVTGADMRRGGWFRGHDQVTTAPGVRYFALVILF
ncbi:putative formin-like protein 5 [Iris pallida]|uniref:Formin-like protein 5 n=1 Tax=Iris pallida TaxID=29817 RepID=A0AAX6IM16_IRIPA|nr:putative formin-like protein 5 [Iris pallida]